MTNSTSTLAPRTRPSPPDLKFNTSDGFYRELKQRVDAYFQSTGLPQRDCPQIYFKTFVIATWLISSYALLVWCPMTWWTALPLAFSLGLAMAAVGFNIQHDGGHKAFSKHRWINNLMSWSLDLMGGSSYCWARKHNVIHHSYSNITGHDDDINIGILGRLTPYQKHLSFHRLQHFYLWFLYGLLPTKWQVYDDFRDVIFGNISGHRIARPKGWDLVIFLGGKAFFFTMAFAVPMMWHPWWKVLVLYGAASFVQGIALSVVFQLAHCVEEAEFPMPQLNTDRMANAWEVHQIETTVDFARGSKLVSWMTGGLNYQIEHHLFPRICHIHYPALSHVVEETCREFGVRYVAQETMWEGVVSHFRWLKRMGNTAESDVATVPT